MNKSQYKFIIQQKARELGFSGVSFAKAEHMDVEALRLE
ncbi:MAG TPA: tRNA epoxyqueuosine(34) reductase QueG, partial [Saprospirales bacterium]|nr:tRNA epoxyqueuosine(34) reductase QueG [Saprospirales bacterium]